MLPGSSRSDRNAIDPLRTLIPAIAHFQSGSRSRQHKLAMLQHMRTDKDDRLQSVTTKRYASPKAAVTRERPPRAVSLGGHVLYFVFAVMTIASAVEASWLASKLSECTIMLGGIAGAYTSGRYQRSRWLGFGIGLVVTFLVIGFAIAVRQSIDGPYQKRL